MRDSLDFRMRFVSSGYNFYMRSCRRAANSLTRSEAQLQCCTSLRRVERSIGRSREKCEVCGATCYNVTRARPFSTQKQTRDVCILSKSRRTNVKQTPFLSKFCGAHVHARLTRSCETESIVTNYTCVITTRGIRDTETPGIYLHGNGTLNISIVWSEEHKIFFHKCCLQFEFKKTRFSNLTINWPTPRETPRSKRKIRELHPERNANRELHRVSITAQ